MSKKYKKNKIETNKIFILDTNVLVHDPKFYEQEQFSNSTIILPITVLEELDKLKKLGDAVGQKARVAIKNIDKISETGEIHNGILMDKDISFKIDVSFYGALGTDITYGDSKILACAVKIKEHNRNAEVVLVSRDINLRIKSRAFNLQAVDYEKDNTSVEELYDGVKIIENEKAGEELKKNGSILTDNYTDLPELFANECVSFINDDGKGIALGKYLKGVIHLAKNLYPWDLEMKNREQTLAANLLLDPNIPLVSLIGKAGTGKSLIALACALELVLNKKMYDNLTIYRPIQPMSSDVGYLPGSLEEKLNPWFSAIDDGFALLFGDKSKKKDGWKNQLHQYITNGTIQKEALTYIRGRSIPRSILLIDEAQQLSKSEIKTILTRCGLDSKIVLTGDIYQIDNAHLDAINNGLTYTIEKFKTSELSGHITLKKGERSKLATIASEIL